MKEGKRTRKVPAFALITLATLMLFSLLLVLLQPWRIETAARLMRDTGKQEGSRQLAEARVAILLSPHNDAYRVALANMYLVRGNAAMALNALPSGKSSLLKLKRAQIQYAGGRYENALEAIVGLQDTESSILRSKVLLELGRAPEAAQAATRARTAAGDRQAALCYAVAGNQTALVALQGRLPTDQFATLKASGIPLARLLQAADMPAATRSVLIASPDNSTAKFSLLAKLELQNEHSTTTLMKAAAYLKKGIDFDSSNLSLHRQLLEVAKEQKDITTINTETSRIHALETGII